MKIAFLLTSCILLLFRYCSAAPQDENQGEKELKLRELQEGVALHGSTDRDMHMWWKDFRDSMAALEKVKQDLVCNDTELLLNKLGELNSTITKVRVELMYKKTQLKELKDVLDHEDYKNTGLSKDAGECKDINDYIKNNTITAEEEDTKLTEEEKQVVDYFTWIADYPCNCVWEEWQSWTGCSKTCGGGIQTQKRMIAKPEKNGGAKCPGQSHMERRCNDMGCPFNCVWKSWTEWTPCPEECVIGGNYQVRSREFEEHRNGGLPCKGNTTEKQPCFIVPILLSEIETQEIEINQLKESLKNCNGSTYDLQLTKEDLETKLCNLLKCKNGGKCIMGSCQCSEGFTGPTCEDNNNPIGWIKTKNIWSDDECDYIARYDGLDLNECKTKCDENPRCTAINYGINFLHCLLCACLLPIPAPQWEHGGYEGYYANAYAGVSFTTLEQTWCDNTYECHYNYDKVSWTLNDAQASCASDPDCTHVYDGACGGFEYCLCHRHSGIFRTSGDTCLYEKIVAQ